MKNIILISIISLIASHLPAQSEGNFKASRSQSYQTESINFENYNLQQQINAIPDANYNSLDNQSIYTPTDNNYAKNIAFAGENVMTLNINALSNQKAKEYVAIFNVTQAGNTAEEADKLLNDRINAFMTGANSLDIGKDNLYVDMVSFLPRYELVATKKVFSKKTYTETPKGFILQKNIHVKFAKPEILDRLISIAAKNEIYEIVKVDYTIENPEKIYQELRNKAFEYLNQITVNYNKIGMKLDSAYKITAENTWATYPATRYSSYQAYSSVSMDAVKGGTQVTEAEKTQTSFYNSIPADNYDIVINPTIIEPVVQYSYNLRVKFTLKERTPYKEVKREQEFIMLTPNGEVKTIKISEK